LNDDERVEGEIRMQRFLAMLAAVLLAACDADNSVSVAKAPARGIDCTALAARVFPDTDIQTAEVVPAGRFVAPAAEPFGPPPDFSGMPEFCRVAGSLKPTANSDIRFELWMPTKDWNRRFIQTGNSGAAGALVYGSMEMPLSRGYAVAHNDAGHRGQGG
jgi:tannase/feruloyl esterase